MANFELHARQLGRGKNPHALALKGANSRREIMLPNGWATSFLYAGKISHAAGHGKKSVLTGLFVVTPGKGVLEPQMVFRSRNGYENRFSVPEEFVGKPLLLAVPQGFDEGMPIIVPEQSKVFGNATYFRVSNEKFITALPKPEKGGRQASDSGFFLPLQHGGMPLSDSPWQAQVGAVLHLNGHNAPYIGFAARRNDPRLMCAHGAMSGYDMLDLRDLNSRPVAITFKSGDIPLAVKMAKSASLEIMEPVRVALKHSEESIATMFGRAPQASAFLILHDELRKTVAGLTLGGLSAFVFGGVPHEGLSMELVNRTLRRAYSLKWLWKRIRLLPGESKEGG